VGVDLFFVLSGFLITGILLDSKEGDRYFRNFYARRTVRIFPLYYAVVFMTLVAMPAAADALDAPIVEKQLRNFGRIDGDEVWYWAYLSNFSIAAAGTFRHSILDISWSLAIEEQFYVFWPLLVFCVSRRVLVRVCVGLIAAAAVLRIGLVLNGTHPISIYVLTPCRMDSLAVGACVAAIVRSDGGIERLAGRCGVVSISGILAFVGLAAFDSFSFPLDGPPWATITGTLTQCVGFTLLAIGFVGLLVLALTSGPSHPLVRLLNARVLRTLGKYSYAIYFFHVPIQAVIRGLIYGPANEKHAKWSFATLAGSELPGQIISYAVVTVITLAVAWVSWQLYEKQFLKLKRFFPSNR
jgi:peptidoglycan/LPS O-acetylase OafA/YrhL